MGSSRPVTPASPRVPKIKPAQPGVPLFGCEHVRILLEGPVEILENTIRAYRTCMCVVSDTTPIIPQTSKTPAGQALTTLTPNYLCLQCEVTTTASGRVEHGMETKHRFYVESRNGYLFCQMCNDFVFDPTLEGLRLRKIGTGSFSSRKRKLDDLFTDASKEDSQLMSVNTNNTPCRASGIRGIYNMGATCYMNVILQSLMQNPLLRNFHLGDGHRSSECTRKNCVACAMDEMFQAFHAQPETVGYSAHNMLACFWMSKRKAYEELASNKEQDAHEFFQFLTEELHEINANAHRQALEDGAPSPKRARPDSSCNCIVHQTFYGRTQSTITCQGCGEIRTSVQQFMDLSLGLDVLSKKKSIKTTGLSVKRCLEAEYKQAERCEYTCHNCGTKEAKKLSSIKSLPNVLSLQLKRFKQSNGSASKIETKVSFPLKLDMYPYTNRARGQDSKQNSELARGCTYELQSVVVHVGNLETGHYISYSRVGNQWFKFNDHNVTLASKSDVLNSEAFILFYVIQSLA
ncbi:ubiquitin carboxyl-terminal hydrolase-like protein [Cadophora sp. DSE1049]|nr:ubiquitin carboxyl-terminal hydrolase-like protein [Cadophora sp. DSE1049]